MFQPNSTAYTQLEQDRSPSEVSSRKSTGFHLTNILELEADDEGSLIKREYKQRIDSMFDETRSNITGSGTDNLAGPLTSSETSRSNSNILNQSSKQSERKKVKNIVQARIEKMFTDVSSSEFEEDMGRASKNILRYQVDYIGSLPLNNKVTSLEGLQEPLKNLYFNYRKTKYPGSNFKSILEISDHGLKVHNFDEKHGHVIEELNPFPKIAVWASMKFVYRPSREGKMGYEYAFLPIVIDPTNSERSGLFRELNHEDFPYAIERTYDDHSPLFVVIMKKSDYYTSNSLQCHGFVCATCEDAIVLAANLYKALVAAMNYNQLNAAKKKKKIKCRYGLGVVKSVGSSSVGDDHEFLFAKEQKILKGNAKSIASKTDSKQSDRLRQFELDGDDEQMQDENNSKNNYSDNKKAEQVINTKTGLKSDSMEDVDYIKTIETTYCDHLFNPTKKSLTNNESFDAGDVLTRVVIPRSGSFMNVSVPVSSRYNRPMKNYGKGSQLQPRKNSIHSPLGFKELFNEFHIQEGLNNIDEILSTIINVNGMSFNSLKPIYKEFIFKFAVTLTKDELYQRSKSIMQKQKRKKRKIMQRTYKTSRKLKRFFHAPWSKLRPRKYRNKKTLITTVSSFFENFKPRPRSFKAKSKLKKHNISMTSASDSFLGLNKMRNPNLIYNPTNTTYSRRPFYLWNNMQDSELKPQDAGQYIHDPILSFNSLSLASRSDHLGSHQPNSLGYFSCSDNSESCAYNTSQRCYCSMKNHIHNDNIHGNKMTPVSSCSCDTDSCLESEKCYCNQSKKPSMIEQLKQQGFAASESSLSRPGSPVLGPSKKGGENRKAKHVKSCVKPSKSLEFFQMEDKPKIIKSRKSSGEYDMFQRLYSSEDQWQNRQQFNRVQKRFDNKRLIRNDSISTSNFQNILRNVPLFKYNDDLDDSLHIMSEDFCSRKSVSRDSFADDSDFVDEHDDMDECCDVSVSRSRFFAQENRSQNKILVVSARDQKGQIKQVFTPMGYGSRRSSNIGRSDQDSDVMSVKKSAEIAALFSGVKIDKRHFNLSSSGNRISSLNASESLLWRSGSLCIKNSNLENSLGYFP